MFSISGLINLLSLSLSHTHTHTLFLYILRPALLLFLIAMPAAETIKAVLLMIKLSANEAKVGGVKNLSSPFIFTQGCHLKVTGIWQPSFDKLFAYPPETSIIQHINRNNS